MSDEALRAVPDIIKAARLLAEKAEKVAAAPVVYAAGFTDLEYGEEIVEKLTASLFAANFEMDELLAGITGEKPDGNS